jgi:hypothetical protein
MRGDLIHPKRADCGHYTASKLEHKWWVKCTYKRLLTILLHSITKLHRRHRTSQVQTENDREIATMSNWRPVNVTVAARVLGTNIDGSKADQSNIGTFPSKDVQYWQPGLKEKDYCVQLRQCQSASRGGSHDPWKCTSGTCYILGVTEKHESVKGSAKPVAWDGADTGNQLIRRNPYGAPYTQSFEHHMYLQCVAPASSA